jgi:hypothetical protein
MSPEARWIPYTAEQVTDSTRSSFRWEARLDPGKITSPTVTDAYEMVTVASPSSWQGSCR